MEKQSYFKKFFGESHSSIETRGHFLTAECFVSAENQRKNLSFLIFLVA